MASLLFEAKFLFSYGSVRVAEAVAEAVSPDNMSVPHGLIVETVRRGKKVLTKIVCEERLLTSIATVDDLLSAVTVAERSVSTVERE